MRAAKQNRDTAILRLCEHEVRIKWLEIEQYAQWRRIFFSGLRTEGTFQEGDQESFHVVAVKGAGIILSDFKIFLHVIFAGPGRVRTMKRIGCFLWFSFQFPQLCVMVPFAGRVQALGRGRPSERKD